MPKVEPRLVTYREIVEAEGRIRDGVLETPCQHSDALSRMTGVDLYCKSEFLQRTGSFKERGARNALLRLSDAERARGVIAASAGNHALALAYHGKSLGIPVTVVMPTFAPLIKQSRCRDYGAQVELSGSNIAESKVLADELACRHGLTYIHGFDGHDVIAGAGTLGLEILRQIPRVDAIIVPVGGGGLIAGLSLAVKATHPHVKIYGVESYHSASFTKAVANGYPTPEVMHATLADGLAVPEVGRHAFELAQPFVERVGLVTEEEISIAILRLLELEKGVVEGAGAAAIAVLLKHAFPELDGKRVVACLCGGNIDPIILGRVIDRALALDGRLAQFSAVISDRPGGLAKFCEIVASTGAGVSQILHERAFAGADFSMVEVDCTVETRNHAHISRLLDVLTSHGIKCALRGAAYPG